MSWTKVEMESTCDIADPGWTEVTMESCADRDSAFAFAGDDPSHADTETRAGSSNWTKTAMRSPCD